MKSLVVLVTLLLALSHAAAGTIYLGAQFGAPDFTAGNGNPTSATVCPTPPSGSCVAVPAWASLDFLSGTLTVKSAGEILVLLLCGGSPVYAGELKAVKEPHTLALSQPIAAGVSGPCWIVYNAINSNGCNDGGCLFEYQLIINYH